MKISTFAIALCALGFSITPSLTRAATAAALSDTTGLFVINFEFTAKDEDYRIPIMAMEGIDTADKHPYVGYTMYAGDEDDFTVDTEKDVALVLSDAKVVDGAYYEIEAGETAKFSLVSLLTIKDSAVFAMSYHTELTKLPYFVGGAKTQMAKETIAKSNLTSDSIILGSKLSSGTFKLESK